jgi:Asp-tRNA(Asn)/Glu-tRNA(Gln) amidotransferase A subunit family amidase
MISLADLQRRIHSGELSAEAAIAKSVAAIEAHEKTIGAFVCRAENPRAATITAIRPAGRPLARRRPSPLG